MGGRVSCGAQFSRVGIVGISSSGSGGFLSSEIGGFLSSGNGEFLHLEVSSDLLPYGFPVWLLLHCFIPIRFSSAVPRTSIF